MDDGNTTNIVVWVTDTVLVYKAMDKQALWYVADAITGKPVGEADIDIFAYRQVWMQDRNYRVDIQQHQAKTDADGEVIVGITDNYTNTPLPAIEAGNPQFATNLQWLTIAKAGGRFAFTAARGCGAATGQISL